MKKETFKRVDFIDAFINRALLTLSEDELGFLLLMAKDLSKSTINYFILKLEQELKRRENETQ